MNAANDNADLARACDELQSRLDSLLANRNGADAVSSLDSAVASFKQVEERNVSSVQLVALFG